MQLSRREFLSFAASGILAERTQWIFDISHYLSPEFKRVRRNETNYVILHCTATDSYFDFVGSYHSLRALTESDRNAHYLISRRGLIYKIVPDDLVANHAGISMWNGETNLNSNSIGIEFQGTCDKAFTSEQYRAFRLLYFDGQNSIKKRFNIDDRNVLGHSQVAYCPNEQVHSNLGLFGKHIRAHRGRKSDPGPFFDRTLARLPPESTDPDIKQGKLLGK